MQPFGADNKCPAVCLDQMRRTGLVKRFKNQSPRNAKEYIIDAS